MIARVFAFLTLAVAACGQLRGPVMGYLPEDGALRPMFGIPAAGSVGDPLAVDRPLSRIEVSPDQTRALALAADTTALMLWAPGAASTVHIQGSASAPDRIVFSPSGTAAALWFSSAQRIQVISGLSATPSVREFDASFLGGDPAGFAVSDDGKWVVGAWSSRVYALGPDGRVAVLPVDGPAEALCFFHGRADVAVITTTQVVIVTDIAGAAVPNVIWTKPNDPLADPAAAPHAQVAVGFAVSFDNNYLSIAGNLGALATFDLTAGTSIGGDCACSPTGLFGMGGSLFRLTGLQDGTVKVFDASTNEIWFVPLAAPAAASPPDGAQQ
jgi:DNA-binding beta-propeller fold protein YncE